MLGLPKSNAVNKTITGGMLCSRPRLLLSLRPPSFGLVSISGHRSQHRAQRSMQAETGPLLLGVWQTVHRSHADHRLVGGRRLGGARDQTLSESVAAPGQLGPALLYRGERRRVFYETPWFVGLCPTGADVVFLCVRCLYIRGSRVDLGTALTSDPL